MAEPLSELENIARACMRRFRDKCPANWALEQWSEELLAQARAAAWEAYCAFDIELEVPLEAFLFLKVKAALHDFCRKEWAYACHCISPTQTEDEGEGENGEIASLKQQDSEIKAWRYIFLRWALAKLSERERLVMERLYWDEWTEAKTAQALKISQQAVSKIKRRAIKKLRRLITRLEKLLF